MQRAIQECRRFAEQFDRVVGRWGHRYRVFGRCRPYQQPLPALTDASFTESKGHKRAPRGPMNSWVLYRYLNILKFRYFISCDSKFFSVNNPRGKGRKNVAPRGIRLKPPASSRSRQTKKELRPYRSSRMHAHVHAFALACAQLAQRACATSASACLRLWRICTLGVFAIARRGRSFTVRSFALHRLRAL